MAETKPEEIFNVLIMIEETGAMAECSAIRHKGKLWLVPNWLDNPSKQTTRPERIIRLDGLQMQPGGTLGNRSFHFLLNVPIPNSVLEGPIQSEKIGNFVVIGLPDIEFPMKARIH